MPAGSGNDPAGTGTTVLPRRREIWIQLIGLLTLAWGAAYLTWRVGWTGAGAQPVLYAVLIAAEILGWVNMAFYVFLAWHVPDTSPVPVTRTRTVDVVVATYDESADVLRATLLGCRAIRHPHRTWLLDDGRREEMQALAEELGAEYVIRPDNSHAKAGNINHALPLLDGELVAVLDADHVPMPDLLDAMVGHFDDPEVVLVQCPHEFYNTDSVQHADAELHEQSLFFRVICPGKERSNSVFWAGSGTVLRREALMEIGGVQTATIAEDFHTSICLHQRGWRTRYVDRTLLLGLAPHDLDAFLLQRSRWARGNLRVFLTRQNPFFARGLRPTQRLSYLGSLFHYFGGPQRAAMLGVLCATLITGLLPLHGPIQMFAILWAPWVLLGLLSTRLLGRGTSGPVAATRHGWTTMGTYTAATLSLLFPRMGRFKVTPKEGIDEGGFPVVRRLGLLSVGTVVLVVFLLARVLQAVGLLDLRALPPFALAATLGIATAELTVILAVLGVLVRRNQRRTVFRFPTDATARVGEDVARIVDLNGHGVGVVMTGAPETGRMIRLTLRLPDLEGHVHDVPVQGVTRSVAPVAANRSAPDRTEGPFRVGIEFTRLGPLSRRRVLECCHLVVPSGVLGAPGAATDQQAGSVPLVGLPGGSESGPDPQDVAALRSVS